MALREARAMCLESQEGLKPSSRHEYLSIVHYFVLESQEGLKLAEHAEDRKRAWGAA